MTIGKVMINPSFNPNKDDMINHFKTQTASMIDLLYNKYTEDTEIYDHVSQGTPDEAMVHQMLLDSAVMKLLEAQMMCVKFITFYKK